MTYRHRVATVFLFGFFLDLINMFIAARWRFPSRNWRGSVMPIFSV